MNDLTNDQVNQLVSFDNALGKSLVDIMPKEYSPLLELIGNNLPEISRATQAFYKSQSRTMDLCMTVSYATPFRNLRQILSEINRTFQALRESFFKMKKTEVEIKILERDYDKEEDELKRELISIDIADKRSSLIISKNYVAGAIRKVTSYVETYNQIKKEKGIGIWTEKDFEEQEEAYHITRAFQQGLCAARSHGGIIDEGNFIYFQNMGVNGLSAQNDVLNYLRWEQECLNASIKIEPTAEWDFLIKMAEKYKGCSKEISKFKGMDPDSESIAIIENIEQMF